MQSDVIKEDFLPLVSIVTPTYNQADYLSETIESVLAQTYPNIEYLVLDDGSTDKTSDVLKQYDGKIYHSRHENQGQAKTLNSGWQLSKGTILGYLSSDDRLKPDAVTKLVAALQSSDDLSVVYCDFDLIDTKGRFFRSVKAEDFDTDRLTIDLVCQPGPGALFKRDVFDRSGGWDERLRQVPDFEFWLRASNLGKFLRVSESLAEYRVHEESASFRAVDPSRSNEIIEVMSKYWCGSTKKEAMQSLAVAYLISAKSHFQSGRISKGLIQSRSVIRHDIKNFVRKIFWRSVLSGIFRKTLFRVRSSIFRD